MISVGDLFKASGGLCWYCGCDTWLPGFRRRMQIRKQFGIVAGVPGSGLALTRRMATREHLHRLADGGANARENLVLACHFCNVTRGRATPGQHRETIARAIAARVHPNHPHEPMSRTAQKRARRAIWPRCELVEVGPAIPVNADFARTMAALARSASDARKAGVA